jgi:acyl-CoA thioester hydrolase
MFYWPVRVYYEDTDSGGVVYYAQYLRFMERARTEWLRTLGIEQDILRERDGIIFAVRSASLEFLRPGRFNDLLQIGVDLIERRAASLRFSQRVLRAVNGDAGGYRIGRRGCSGPSEYRGAAPMTEASPAGELLCTGDVEIACLDAVRFRPRRLPDFLSLEVRSDA